MSARAWSWICLGLCIPQSRLKKKKKKKGVLDKSQFLAECKQKTTQLFKARKFTHWVRKNRNGNSLCEKSLSFLLKPLQEGFSMLSSFQGYNEPYAAPFSSYIASVSFET